MDKKCFLLRVRLNQWTEHISPCLVIYNLHTELPMDCFNGILGINDPLDIFRVLEILAEPFPVVAPAFDYDQIFVIPFFVQNIQRGYRSLLDLRDLLKTGARNLPLLFLIYEGDAFLFNFIAQRCLMFFDDLCRKRAAPVSVGGSSKFPFKDFMVFLVFPLRRLADISCPSCESSSDSKAAYARF